LGDAVKRDDEDSMPEAEPLGPMRSPARTDPVRHYLSNGCLPLLEKLIVVAHFGPYVAGELGKYPSMGSHGEKR
jgi:hypothetical protein